MASTLYKFEAVNMFAGDEDADNSKHATLENVKLPDFEEASEEFRPGGSIAALNIGGLGLNALEIGIKTKGYDPQMRKLFGLGNGNRRLQRWTIYGAYRDLRSGELIELKAVAQGRLTSMTQDEMARGSLQGMDYKITEVVHYEEKWNGKEINYYDHFTSTWRVDGVSQNRDVNNILRIPGGV